MSPRKILIIALMLAAALLIVAPAAAQQTVHVVQPGENLFRIALQYGVGMDAIAQANGISNTAQIYAGQQLVIPNYDAAPAVVENPMVAVAPDYHTVQDGETLDSIALMYGLTVEQLMQSNNLFDRNWVLPGQQLLVWNAPVATTTVEGAPVEVAAANLPPIENVAATTQTTYVVQPGEHLARIAQRFNLSWTIIAQANNLTDPNQIYAGQTLIIPTGSVSVANAVDGTTTYTPVYAPAPPTIYSGKQVVVDLSDSRVYAYQDGVLVRDVLVSTGLPATPTVIGDYTVYVKYPAQTMSGPGYYLPDVPYVMYFYQGYSLHGTYWHSNWGQPMSHGCVNMPTPEAEWFYYNFVEVGTPIHVQY
ncbi:MAG TPA: LysM peptidoglycan-binding domain-containing protein [Phototrophicaceae bacterium]|nr:LysM peptidoglycan-binding domain-containing protein [Phototrophicaceae bacterium]